MKSKPISFDDFRRFLHGLGYAEKRTDTAHVFHKAGQDLLVFRLYRPEEDVDERDLLSTRKFLDLRGLLEAAEFDGSLRQTATSA